MTLTTVDLLDMSQADLDDLFKRSPAGPIPVGEGQGTVIAAPAPHSPTSPPTSCT